MLYSVLYAGQCILLGTMYFGVSLFIIGYISLNRFFDIIGKLSRVCTDNGYTFLR